MFNAKIGALGALFCLQPLCDKAFGQGTTQGEWCPVGALGALFGPNTPIG